MVPHSTHHGAQTTHQIKRNIKEHKSLPRTSFLPSILFASYPSSQSIQNSAFVKNTVPTHTSKMPTPISHTRTWAQVAAGIPVRALPFSSITQNLTHQPGTPTQTSNPFALHARFLGARLPDKDHDSQQSNGAHRVSGLVGNYSIRGEKPTSSSNWDYWTAYMSSLSRFRAQSDREPRGSAIVFDHVDGYCAGVSRLFVAEDRGEVLVV
jgi:hypothetical protein